MFFILHLLLPYLPDSIQYIHIPQTYVAFTAPSFNLLWYVCIHALLVTYWQASLSKLLTSLGKYLKIQEIRTYAAWLNPSVKFLQKTCLLLNLIFSMKAGELDYLFHIDERIQIFNEMEVIYCAYKQIYMRYYSLLFCNSPKIVER
jgi:hypothetical protein